MAIIETEAPLHEAHRDNHTHRDVNGGWLRPAVFGAMDGLVSNLALMTGVAGGAVGAAHHRASPASRASPPAPSPWPPASTPPSPRSASSSRPSWTWSGGSCASTPQDEEAELAALYESRGVEPALAREVARQLSRDPEQALEIHAREELGIDPGDLPSPTVAAVSCFGSFALGALLPVLPYLLGATALWPAVLLALLGLFAVRCRRGQGDGAHLVVQRAAAARSWEARRPV